MDGGQSRQLEAWMEAEDDWEADGWMRMTVTGWMTVVWVDG